MKQKFTRAVLFSSIVALSACDVFDDDDDNSPVQTPTQTGVFIDAPVAGIGYRTLDANNNVTREGVTNADGEYDFIEGERVVFFIGGIELPPVTAKGKVTPVDIALESDSEANINSDVVVNIARLLQSLDDDGNPDNGITIPDTLNPTATVDVSAAPAAFEAAFSAEFPTEDLVSAAGASNHLQQSIDEDPDIVVPPAPFRLQLLHFADVDGGRDIINNAVSFSALVADFRDDYANTLVLSSGDNWIPGPEYSVASDDSFAGLFGVPGNGRAHVAYLNALGVQASAFGNHEFDLGTGDIAGLLAGEVDGDNTWVGAQFPYLSANLDFSTDADLSGLVADNGQEANTLANKIAASTVVTLNGEKVGIVGATTPTLAGISSPGDVTINPASGAIADLAAVIQSAVDALTAQSVDKVILLSHMQQIAVERELASLLNNVDIIVAGGSNTILADDNDVLRGTDTAADTYPIVVTETDKAPVLLVNTDGDYTYLGRLVLEFNDSGEIDLDSLDAAINGAYATDAQGLQNAGLTAADAIPEVKAVSDALTSALTARAGNVFGLSNVYLNGERGSVRTEETNLGQLTADANLAYAQQQDPTVAISIKNGGGIRAAIGQCTVPAGATDPDAEECTAPAGIPGINNPGEISQLDLEIALRFNNSLTLLTLTGEELKQILEHAVADSAAGSTPGRFPQVSGVSFSFDTTETAQVTTDGVVTSAGTRIRSLVVGDANGADAGIEPVIVVENGELNPQAAKMTFRIVTLGFLAGGGDGYPFPSGAEANVLDLEEDTADGNVTFANNGTEQDALAEYLFTRFPADDDPSTPAFDVVDVDASEDSNIQNLAEVPEDTVIANIDRQFNRIASFLVCSQLDASCDVDDETAAEIVDVSGDGMTLIYSDSPLEVIGFIDITDPASPVAAGTLDVGGEPTSVAVVGDYALVGVNTSVDFVNTSGELLVVDIANQTIVTSLDLGGQPDAVAVSPDGTFAAVAIENERDEDLNDGQIDINPQSPAGFVVVVDIADTNPANWSTSNVDVTDLAAIAPTDPEPEYVDINSANVAVVTMQENNHLVLIDLATATVINHFTAGTVNLDLIDVTEGDLPVIDQSESQVDIPREADGVTWIGTDHFATADEGDMNGGSRGFTIYNTNGDIVYTSGADLDHLTARLGHYPDGRSGNKGNEPENAEYAIFGNDQYLFVNSERSSLIFVYDVANPAAPVFIQALPAAAGPEGVKAIPSRNLLVAASEEDSRGDKLRSVVNIYEYGIEQAVYPTIVSTNRANGTPIPWAAMSGLAADATDASVLYSIEDSAFASSRIFKLDISSFPAVLNEEIRITDTNAVFANIAVDGASEDDELFDAVDLDALINDDNTVNIDPEGIAIASNGGFWVASEGSGTFDDTSSRPIISRNFIFKVDATGVIEQVITLPASVNAIQLRFGFEGVAEQDGKLYVTFQRAWNGEAHPRIGIYDLAAQTWSFVYYPLDARESQNGGWVGLSDLTALGNGRFLVLERDNQGGPDAAIKRLYEIDLSADVAVDDASIETAPVVRKQLVRDVLADLSAQGNLPFEKVEGSVVTANGDVFIINDNDGVDDNSGETQLIHLGHLNEIGGPQAIKGFINNPSEISGQWELFVNGVLVNDGSLSQAGDLAFNLASLAAGDTYEIRVSGGDVSDCQVVNGSGVVGIATITDVIIDCEVPRLITLFEDNFDSGDVNKWEVVDHGGSNDWHVESFSGNFFAVGNCFGSDSACDDWMITPELDMTQFVSARLAFTNAWNFGENELEQISVLVSTNYLVGTDPSQATWDNISDQVNWSGGSFEFVNSGDIDLSAYVGNFVYVAFYYETPVEDSTKWEIDDVIIDGLATGEFPLSAEISVAGDSFFTGREVNFSGAALNGAGEPYTYSWDFGDGNFATGADVTHTFTSSGVYQVLLTVGDAGSTLETVSAFVAVEDSTTFTMPQKQGDLRIAAFNAGLDRFTTAGEMAAVLATGDDVQAQKLAEIIQRADADILLLNEIDGNDSGATVAAFKANYLEVAQATGSDAIMYDHVYTSDCNTGVPSGEDLDNSGATDDPGDGFGFGNYPGQYCMAIFSKYPLELNSVRTFQNFLWQDMPNFEEPILDGTPWYSAEELAIFRLSSKTHIDLPVNVNGNIVHVLASHPTPPVFDGAEDRNGKRNFDEIRLWADYVDPAAGSYLYDDNNNASVSLAEDARFVILGDQNASAVEGDAFTNTDNVQAIDQLLLSPMVNPNLREDSANFQVPISAGGADFSEGNVFGSTHTASFRLRADYVLPSAYGFEIAQSGVFWPRETDDLYYLVSANGAGDATSSDHRMVWMDLTFTDTTVTVPGDTADEITVLFEDDFSTEDLAGWISVDNGETALNWHVETFGETSFAVGNCFRGAEICDDWMYQTFDLSAASAPMLSFVTAQRFGSNPFDQFSVLVSDAFTGDVTTTNWVDITSQAALSDGDFNEVASGDIDLSAFAGQQLTLAFHYNADPANSTKWEVTDVLLFEVKDPIVLQDDFSTEDLAGWTTVDNGESALNWHVETFDDTSFAVGNCFRGSETCDDWLYRTVNLVGVSEPELSFITAQRFGSNPFDQFSVLVSDAFTGDVTTTNWDDLTSQAALSDGDFNEVASGAIDLSAYAGSEIVLAFHYLADPANSTKWEVTDVLVQEKPADTGNSDPRGGTVVSDTAPNDVLNTINQRVQGDLVFDAVTPPANPGEETAVLTSASLTLNSNVVADSGYQTLAKSGDVFAGGTYGQVTDINGDDIFVSNMHEFASLLPVGDRLFSIAQFESIPGGMSLSELSQSANGDLSVISTQNIDFSGLNGGYNHCAASVTPWNTHLAAEEFEPDYGNRNPGSGAIDFFYDQIADYHTGASLLDVNPYWYGYPVEVTVSIDGSNNEALASVEKHYAVGRMSIEVPLVMPDGKTLYLTDDGTNGGFFMFIADTAEDLSAGTLYAMKWNQTDAGSADNAGMGAADIEWISLGHATTAEIDEMINGAAPLAFSDIFERVAPAGDCPLGYTSINFKGNHECLIVKPGMEKAASRLETRRYAAYLGATVEFRKSEGLTYNQHNHKMYMAISDVNRGMLAGTSQDEGGPDHMQLSSANSCGGIYEMDLGGNTDIGSDYVVAAFEGMIVGAEEGSACDIDNIAGPDNVAYIGFDTLIITEDTSDHDNNFVWAYNLVDESLTRILSAPLDAENTAPYMFNNINGFSYLTNVVQHPGGERANPSAGNEAELGYFKIPAQ